MSGLTPYQIDAMATPPLAYVPISCDIHDRLEICALTRKPTQILLRDGDSEVAVQRRNVVITDVYARGGAEYLVLSTGETLRFDQLAGVDGIRLTVN
jgi:Rho-binding antiterminator